MAEPVRASEHPDPGHLVDLIAKANDVSDGIRNRREALSAMDANLHSINDLGAIDVETPDGARLSVLGVAVLYGDGPMANRLVDAGARLREDEHPASLIAEARHAEALESGLDDDHAGTTDCLRALAKSGQDLNAPIEGVTPAAFVTMELIGAKMEIDRDDCGDNPYAKLGAVLHDCADAGLDFNARCPDGLSLEDQVKGYLEGIGMNRREIEDEMPPVRRVQRDGRVRNAAVRMSERGGENSQTRDQNER